MDIIIFVIIFILLSLVTYNCNINESSGSVVKFRPPSIVFSIVWPIIFILLYLAKEEDDSEKDDYLYYLLFASFFIWSISYGCANYKSLGIYAILTSLTILRMIENDNNKFYLSPIYTWLLFALLLNVVEVQSLSN